MIITLTKMDETDKIPLVHINPSHIVRVKTCYNGTGYELIISDGEHIFINESPEQINKIIAGQTLHDVVFKDE